MIGAGVSWRFSVLAALSLGCACGVEGWVSLPGQLLSVTAARAAGGSRSRSLSCPTSSRGATQPLPAVSCPREVEIGDLITSASMQTWDTMPSMWEGIGRLCPDQPALLDALHSSSDRPAEEYTYGQLLEAMRTMGGGLQALGVKRGDSVSVFSENSSRWLIADGGLMLAGGVNAVRGAAAATQELQYIYRHSSSVAAILETPAVLKTLMEHGGIGGEEGVAPRFVLILHSDGKSSDELRAEFGVDNIFTFEDCMARGDGGKALSPLSPPLSSQDFATILYTSGTTGSPKGVPLTHRNLMHQVVENSFQREGDRAADPHVGDIFLSILPCWHIFERSAEYYFLARGVKMVYSNVRTFKKDLKSHRPHYLVAVPRLYETIYKGVEAQFASQPLSKRILVKMFRWASKQNARARHTQEGLVLRRKLSPPSFFSRGVATVTRVATHPLASAADKLVWSKVREGLGGRIKVLVSGGSLLPGLLEHFFDVLGTTVIVGYGLTETSPVISSRLAEHNLLGSVGSPPPGTDIKILHVDTKMEVAPGKVGVVWAKGPQVMGGYLNDAKATAEVMNKDGYFCTGDLGRINKSTGDIIITGRAKDTIVLSNGENVEPEPLENLVCSECSLIDQIMIMGQDQKHLSAVVVVNPMALAGEGLVSPQTAQSFASLIGGSPLTQGCAGSRDEVRKAESALSKVPGVAAAVLDQMKATTQAHERPPWETITSVHVTLEPFTVPNGLLTQTLKIKRPSVLQRYADKLKALGG